MKRIIMSMIKKSELDEFVDSEGGMIQGDRNVTNDSEIETGPIQKPFNDDSDYEKGMSTTTDRAARYRQNIPWFAVYSYGGSRGQGLPISETENMNIITKKQMEDKIKEDLVKKSKNDGDVWEKNHDIKIDKVVDMINDADFSEEQLDKIKKAVLSKFKN